MNRTHAQELATEARDALAGFDFAPLVTLSGDEANANATEGPLVLIQPPRVEYGTYAQATAQWTVILVSPLSDQFDAWDQLDEMAEALRIPLDVDKADPTNFQAPQGKTLPALVLSLTTEHYLP